MSMEGKGYRRISLSVPVQLADRMDKYIPWGNKGKIMETLLEKAITDVVREGQYILADLLYGNFNIQYGRLEDRDRDPDTDG